MKGLYFSGPSHAENKSDASVDRRTNTAHFGFTLASSLDNVTGNSSRQNDELQEWYLLNPGIYPRHAVPCCRITTR